MWRNDWITTQEDVAQLNSILHVDDQEKVTTMEEQFDNYEGVETR